MTDLHPDKLAELVANYRSAKANGDPAKYVHVISVKQAHETANTIEALQARLDRTREVIERGYRGVNKTDQCEHGKFGFEDCIACYDSALLEALNGERM